jgi:predicted DNA-binding transcriptional regulator AlpA
VTDRRTPFNDLPEYLSIPELQDCLGIGRSAAYDFVDNKASGSAAC